MSGKQNADALVLDAMLAMAEADGQTDARELARIAQIYLRVTGNEIGADGLAAAAEARRASADALTARLAAASGTLDREAKESIVRAAYLVLLADDAITAQERKTLRDLADALKVPEVHFGAIMEDAALWLAKDGS